MNNPQMYSCVNWTINVLLISSFVMTTSKDDAVKNRPKSNWKRNPWRWNWINHSWVLVVINVPDSKLIRISFSLLSRIYFLSQSSPIYISNDNENMIILNYMLWWQKAKKRRKNLQSFGICLMNCCCNESLM